MSTKRRIGIFAAGFVLAYAGFILWGFWVLTDGRWTPGCTDLDYCTPDMIGVYKVGAIFATIVAAGVLGLATPGLPRKITVAMMPVAAAAVVFFLVPEVREFIFP